MDLLGEHARGLLVPSYLQQAYRLLNTAQGYAQTLLSKISANPDLTTIALLLVIVLVSLQILNMLYNSVIFWFRVARRMAFWGGLIGIALWLYARGPDGVAQDVQYWYETWNREYKYWKEQESSARFLQQTPKVTQRHRFY
jgi:Na+/proline symporter